jgi:mannose-6-phosphate isomerase-like protein (cupin superfamily)
MDFRDHHEWIEEGEFIIVPRGVEHRPVADAEVQVMLFEPAGTPLRKVYSRLAN